MSDGNADGEHGGGNYTRDCRTAESTNVLVRIILL